MLAKSGYPTDARPVVRFGVELKETVDRITEVAGTSALAYMETHSLIADANTSSRPHLLDRFWRAWRSWHF
jgi:hypothetical protein